ncbi:hypothetical protein NEUTE1DRAFT_124458 [Neurospora tetrasperma FGSC 2508]|uniref:DUF21-domain-containing protein n=1 Tax=Neurospora tetrasperma (strain FGSC 2508 / ATCC MYA-4615 / P0657) TaxID=510951 RepID=F8MWL0_NEUT8|nr:uncharacterized protein NEUTE1DRAFT_124458 [Neurospora tetrasperma FGSC 2508]EGO54131.1 hypothetical protein NEUTE1DRAFT_124458 [Neurospora tetrasperma FGSC 2508]EGZ68443.1 DUF21-domain-containing protein [Neurospora tetrasperma FGSC 2509]
MGISTVTAAPIHLGILEHGASEEPEEGGASLWVLYLVSAVLVLVGGAFAGLTIALMGQDGIYLQVLARDRTEPQQKNAKRVYDLLQRGKHWVLVTLLLSNVIVNETLPVVLDRCLGGGVAAVIGSTVLIVIFGEVIPQSLCVRYGLPIGGYMAKPVLLLMYLTAPVSYPIAKLLDKLLGEDHGTVYKKSGLKTLVTLHKNLGDVSERLNQDEVTIISAVLDLKEKPVASVMTPMEDVFVMAEDTVLDEKTMDMILSAGYSRIPIHETGNPTNFVGMLLVKILITYDPEDCKRVKDFPLATLPETRPETSCLDIVNFFQEGKSHMVLVSEYPGEDHGAIGVVTLEDVIEELIGEEIIDESDVYIDVHKAIRRLTPAPKARITRRVSEDVLGKTMSRGHDDAAGSSKTNGVDIPPSKIVEPLTGAGSTVSEAAHLINERDPKQTTFMMRRSSTGVDGQMVNTTVPVRTNLEELRQHLKHLGPSNPAINPKSTRSTTVKIKPGIAGHLSQARAASIADSSAVAETSYEDDETTSLLRPQQSTAKDGIQALTQSYGGVSPATAQLISPAESAVTAVPIDMDNSGGNQDTVDKSTQTPTRQQRNAATDTASGLSDHGSNGSSDSVASIRDSGPLPHRRGIVRSGSITENIIETRGVRKVVLETNSSNDEEEYAITATSPGDGRGAKVTVSIATPSARSETGDETQGLLPLTAGDEGHQSGDKESESAKTNGGGQSSSQGKKNKSKKKKRKGGKS